MAEIKFNPIDMMVDSGARGNSQQIRQIAGMKGLVSNPRGEMIPRPIKSSFREGLSVLEYFISTHGARKGLADTALRTADSGYLTRRLVDVAQELIVREDDCGSVRGIWIEGIVPDGAGTRSYLETRVTGRILSEPVTLSDKSKLEAGTVLTDELVARLRDDAAIDRVRTRSVLTCEAEQGICAACYGLSLATGEMIELGEAVGVIAAQSIGEPGTQLTMRTFHTGGIVGEDITHGLPRVVELFEARTPKGAAVLARHSGVARVEEDESGRHITVVADDGEEHTVLVAQRAHLEVADGQEVAAGDALVEGPKDPKELLEVKGIRETQQYLVEEVQKVYRDQGVSIHDKHIELIVRQMLRRVLVAEPGDASFLPGERVDSRIYAEVNRALVTDGKRPAEGRPELMGITKASLATESWLSAASFQETTRVLTEAAIEGKSDQLFGLKENIIIGKLIPAGSGMERYRDIKLEMPGAEAMPAWALGRHGHRHRGPGRLAAGHRWRRVAGHVQLGHRRQLARCRAVGRGPGRRVAGLRRGRRARGRRGPDGRRSLSGTGVRRSRAPRTPGPPSRAAPAGPVRRGRTCPRRCDAVAWNPCGCVSHGAARLRAGGRSSRPGHRHPRSTPAQSVSVLKHPCSPQPRGHACPRFPSSSAKAGPPSRQSRRRRPSAAPPSAAACAPACTPTPRRSRTRRCARSPVCG